jgi:glycosyltransferase involved in cell wall biosynthesis
MSVTKTKVGSAIPRGVVASEVQVASRPRLQTVALFDWSQLIEDYLDNIGVSFDDFCSTMNGGWMFGYISALKTAGVSTILFCVSAAVSETTYFKHAPTGARICVLPAPKSYRRIRQRLVDPYGQTVEDAVGFVNTPQRLLWGTVKLLAPYLSSPLVKLAREIRREKCDALICQDYEHGRFDLSVLLGRLIGIPVFATFQGGVRATNPAEARLRKTVIKVCDGLITGAANEAERLSKDYGVVGPKLGLIPNPIDTSEWQPQDKVTARASLKISPDKLVVMWHGRTDYRRKGLDVLLRAWKAVYETRSERDLELILVGSGADAAELRKDIAALKVEGLTWFDQFVSDRSRIRAYLSAADIFVFPSRHEGFAVAPLEAMACGLPLVSTDAGGMADVLAHGEDDGGILVRSDDPDALATVLGRLVDDPHLRQRMGTNSRRRIEATYSLSAVGAELMAFMSKNAGSRRHAN